MQVFQLLWKMLSADNLKDEEKKKVPQVIDNLQWVLLSPSFRQFKRVHTRKGNSVCPSAFDFPHWESGPRPSLTPT